MSIKAEYLWNNVCNAARDFEALLDVSENKKIFGVTRAKKDLKRAVETFKAAGGTLTRINELVLGCCYYDTLIVEYAVKYFKRDSCVSIASCKTLTVPSVTDYARKVCSAILQCVTYYVVHDMPSRFTDYSKMKQSYTEAITAALDVFSVTGLKSAMREEGFKEATLNKIDRVQKRMIL